MKLHKITIGNIFFVFIASIAVLAFRHGDAFTKPQLWAEDGNVFLQQYYQFGLRSLIIPYGGYLQLLPRLIAFICGVCSINLLYIPAIYISNAAIITFLIALSLFDFAEHQVIKRKFLFAISFLLIPVGSEMFMNLVNISWILSLYLIITIIASTDKNGYIHYLLLIAISLTGPPSLLLLPVICLELVIDRKKMTIYRIISLSIIASCGIIQIFVFKNSSGVSAEIGGDPEKMHFIRLFVNNIHDLLFFNNSIFAGISNLKQAALSLLVLAAFLYLLCSAYVKIKWRKKYLLLLIPAIFFSGFIFSYWPRESKVLAFSCPRYYIVPFTCFFWIFVLAYNEKIKTYHILAYLLFFVAHYADIQFFLPDKHWSEQVHEHFTAGKDTLEINPGKWTVYIPE